MTVADFSVSLADFVAAANEGIAALPREHPDCLSAVFASSALRREGTWIEFGVWRGASLRRLAAERGVATLVGLDSFRGLPKAEAIWKQGEFALEPGEQPPTVDGATILVGMFDEVLRTFEPSEPVTLAHIDCDLYESASVALLWLRPRLARGAVIVFDELTEYAGYENGEMRALYESRIAFQWLARGRLQGQVAIRCV